jgi:hypothetical protein
MASLARALFVCLIATGVTGWAATLERLTLEQMAEKATVIVRGRIGSSQAMLQGPLIYTLYQVEVQETWKGRPAPRAQVAVPGGSYRGVRQNFSGSPTLDAGAEYVLFLWTGPSGLTQLIGLSQGVFHLSASPEETSAYRPAASESLFDRASASFVSDTPLRLSLSELRRRVTASQTPGGAR